jgi:hypothetical protein
VFFATRIAVLPNLSDLDLLISLVFFTSTSALASTMLYATTYNNSTGGSLGVKVFEAYIQKRLHNSIHGGLRCHRKDQIKDEILADISTLSDSALEEWVAAIDV